MKKQTKSQLIKKYGHNYWFIVGGNFGERVSCDEMSEAEAIREYESRRIWSCTKFHDSAEKPKAAYIIICQSERNGGGLRRGWIDDTHFEWDNEPCSDGTESISFHKIK